MTHLADDPTFRAFLADAAGAWPVLLDWLEDWPDPGEVLPALLAAYAGDPARGHLGATFEQDEGLRRALAGWCGRVERGRIVPGRYRVAYRWEAVAACEADLSWPLEPGDILYRLGAGATGGRQVLQLLFRDMVVMSLSLLPGMPAGGWAGPPAAFVLATAPSRLCADPALPGVATAEAHLERAGMPLQLHITFDPAHARRDQKRAVLALFPGVKRRVECAVPGNLAREVRAGRVDRIAAVRHSLDAAGFQDTPGFWPWLTDSLFRPGGPATHPHPAGCTYFCNLVTGDFVFRQTLAAPYWIPPEPRRVGAPIEAAHGPDDPPVTVVPGAGGG